MSVSTKKNVDASSIGKQVVNISPMEKLELIKKYELENGVSIDTLFEKANLLISLENLKKQNLFFIFAWKKIKAF